MGVAAHISENPRETRGGSRLGYRVAKRLFDVVAAILGLLVLSPVLAVIAISVYDIQI